MNEKEEEEELPFLVCKWTEKSSEEILEFIAVNTVILKERNVLKNIKVQNPEGNKEERSCRIKKTETYIFRVQEKQFRH